MLVVWVTPFGDEIVYYQIVVQPLSLPFPFPCRTQIDTSIDYSIHEMIINTGQNVSPFICKDVDRAVQAAWGKDLAACARC